MSPEHGPGSEGQDFIAPGSEEVKAELDAREEGRLQLVRQIEERLESIDASMDEVRRNDQPDKHEALRHLDDRRRHLEERLFELEKNN